MSFAMSSDLDMPEHEFDFYGLTGLNRFEILQIVLALVRSELWKFLLISDVESGRFFVEIDEQ